MRRDDPVLRDVAVQRRARDAERFGFRGRVARALLARAIAAHPALVTKSGLMFGLGERDDEVRDMLRDLRMHGVDVLTLGQYLAPSAHHLPVRRYVRPDAFAAWRDAAPLSGIREVVAELLVHSSYHAAEVLRAA